MGIWFFEYPSTRFWTEYLRKRVFDFNMKVYHALFLKAFATWLTADPINVMMDIIDMLPKIMLFL